MADAGKIIALAKAAVGADVDELKSAIDKLTPNATASDIGKALIVKTVANGKPSSYEYGEAGGGGTVIDDTAGAGDTDKAWSADKIVTEIQQIIVSGGVPIDDTAGQGDIDKLWSADKIATLLEYEKTYIPSKNLNVTPYPASDTQRTVDITTNADNSVTFDGTPTGSIYFPDITNTAYRWELPAGSYVLSGGKSNNENVQIFLYATKDASTAVTNYASTNKSKTFTTNQTYWAVIRIAVVTTAVSYSNTKFEPQLEVGSTATSYVSPWPTTETSTIIDDLKESAESLGNRMTEAESDIAGLDNSMMDFLTKWNAIDYCEILERKADQAGTIGNSDSMYTVVVPVTAGQTYYAYSINEESSPTYSHKVRRVNYYKNGVYYSNVEYTDEWTIPADVTSMTVVMCYIDKDYTKGRSPSDFITTEQTNRYDHLGYGLKLVPQNIPNGIITSQMVSGGLVSVDDTLKVTGEAADAKVVGDELAKTNDYLRSVYFNKGASPKLARTKKLCIIGAGQSNIEGRVPVSELPSGITLPMSGLKYAKNSTTGTMLDSIPSDLWGFDVVTCYYLIQNLGTNNLYYIKWAVGATPIDPSSTTSESKWTADYEQLDSESHALLLKFDREIRLCKNQNPDEFEIGAMLWHQGEGDYSGASATAPGKYYENLKKVIAYCRGVVGNSRLPFICGTISHNSAQYDATVEAAILRLASEDPYMWVVDMSNAALLDLYHFDAAWSEYFGKKAYDCLIDAGVITGTKLNPSEPT